MAESEIEQIHRLVEEYNQVEIQQAERLKQLYRLVRPGGGYKTVIFRHGVTWSNVWSEPENLILPRLVDHHIRLITSVEPGERDG